MDESFIKKLEDQEWEIPPSNRYVSDSDSPLSLLSSPVTMPSPTMPSPIISPASSTNHMSSMMLPPPSPYTQEPLQLSYPKTHYPHLFRHTINAKNIIHIEKDEQDEEEKEYCSVMYDGEHIIASNDRISCVRPSSVSIQWSPNNKKEQPPPTTIGTEDDALSVIDFTCSSLSSNEEEEYSSSDNSIPAPTTNIITKEEDQPRGDSPQVEALGVVAKESISTEEKVEVVLEAVESPEQDRQYRQDYTPPPPLPPTCKRKYDNIVPNTTSSNSISDTDDDDDYTHTKKNSLFKKRKPVAALSTISNTMRNKMFLKKSSLLLTSSSSNKKKKRTVTSYDHQTSHYLKSIFFEVYSEQTKLTKAQRAQVQERTGLPSRNITYWFSNHKRRFQDTLKIYRKIVQDSDGAIETYDEFLDWRREHGLPDQITQDEVTQYQREYEN